MSRRRRRRGRGIPRYKLWNMCFSFFFSLPFVFRPLLIFLNIILLSVRLLTRNERYPGPITRDHRLISRTNIYSGHDIIRRWRDALPTSSCRGPGSPGLAAHMRPIKTLPSSARIPNLHTRDNRTHGAATLISSSVRYIIRLRRGNQIIIILM